MNKFILLTLIAIVASKNVILIGDSRYVGIASDVMGFPYSTIINNGGSGTNIRSTSPKSYGGHSIQVTAQVGASSYTFKPGTDIYNSMHSQLKNASPGTTVLLWLGINDYNAIENTYSFYSGLAKQYSSLTFYAIPITGVNENKTWIRNSAVQNFNIKLEEKIKNGRISNLTFKSILFGNDVNTIIVDGSALAIVNYMTGDGLHYTKNGYLQLWKAMSQKL